MSEPSYTGQKDEYYIINRKALPTVFSQVIEAKKLLASGRARTVQEAVEKIGISRSSFYKYKDMIEPFSDMVRRKAVTISAQLEDRPGVLPEFLQVVEHSGVNILTINQTIPIGGLADVTMSIEVLENSWHIDDIIGGLRGVRGVNVVRILARE